MERKHKLRGAFYLRLSKDDDNQKESSSISNQRKLLQDYAEKAGCDIVAEFCDDGVSGTTFDRPGFNQLIQAVENGLINLILVKDLSRLGRDYIQTGQYTEVYFPAKNVRFIAVNDEVDSDQPLNDLAPFRNVVNEMVARDTSRKIRSSFQTKMREGAFIGNFAPYGYQKDKHDKNHLVIDPNTAPIVHRIFEMAAFGCSSANIAKSLNEQKISSPAVYRCQKYPHLKLANYTQKKAWSASTIRKILKNPVYRGHTAQGKSVKSSFKNRHVSALPMQEWIIVENTHEAVVEQELFDLANEGAKQRQCVKKDSFVNSFSKIAVCADCHHGMSTIGSMPHVILACGSYKSHGKSICSNHFIDYNDLMQCTREVLKRYALLDEAEKREVFAEIKEELSPSKHENERIDELNHILDTLYLDYYAGTLSAQRFEQLKEHYEAEKSQLDSLRQTADDTVDFEKIYRDIIRFDELSPQLLSAFFESIEISQGSDENHEKQQQIVFHPRFKIKP